MIDPDADPRDVYGLLYTFLGGYLYESWSQDYSGPYEAFDEFLTDSGVDDLHAFAREADDLLAKDEPHFLSSFAALSRNLTPRSDYGWSEREWLTSLRDRAVAELERRGEAGR